MRPVRARRGGVFRGSTAVGLCLIASAAAAQDVTWALPGDGNWNTADPNWAGVSTLFTDGNSVGFGTVGGATVTIDTAPVLTPEIALTESGFTIATSGGFAIQPSGGALALTLSPGVSATISAPLVSAGGDAISTTGDATSSLTLSGDNSGSLGTFTVASGGVVLDGAYGGAVSNAGSLTNNATITGAVTNTGTVSAAGTFTGGITNTAGTVTVTGDSSGDVTNAGGDLVINGGQTLTGDVSNADAASATTINGALTGNLTLSDGTVGNAGTVTGATVVNGGTLTNTGTLDGTVLLDQTGAVAAALDDTGGVITGLVTNTDGAITANGTDFQAGLQHDGGTTTATGVDFGTGVTNAGGTITIDGATPATSTGNVTNSGGDLTIAAGQTLTGNVSNADAASATVMNGTLTGDLTLSDGTASNAGTVTGATVVNGGALTNTGRLDGTVLLDQTGAVAVALDDTSGVITGLVTNTDGAITADGTDFQAGLLQNGGTTSATGVDFGTGVTNAGGTITLGGAGAATSTGDVANTGGDLVIDADETLVGDVTNADAASRITNDGQITGDVTLTDGDLDNNGTIAGDVDFSLGSLFGDDGTITGRLTQSGGASVFNESAVDGGIAISDGRTTIRGDTTADIDNTGGIVVIEFGQTLTGDKTQTDGRTRVSGTLDGYFIASGGRVTHEVDAEITGLVTLRGGVDFSANGGTFGGGLRIEDAQFALNSPLVADVVNAGETLSFGAGQTVDGDFLNAAGSFDFASTITGALTVDDGTVTANSGAEVQGATAVNGGTLDILGGDFDGGITVDGGDAILRTVDRVGGLTVADGTLEVQATAAVTSDLSVTGGAATVLGDLTGDVTQSAGLVTQAGELDGAVALSGGSFINADGIITGATTVTGGTLTAGGGDFGGGVTNDGGTVLITGTSTGDIANQSGTVAVQTGGVLTGDVTNAGIVTGQGGSLSGALTNTGTVNVTGGDLTVGGLTTSGAVTVTNGNQLTFGTGAVTGGTVTTTGSTLVGDLSVSAGTVAATNGTLVGDVTFSAGGFDATGGTVDGTLTTAAETTLTVDGLAITGDFVNRTDFASAGVLAVDGDFDMAAGDLTVASGATQVGGTLAMAAGTTLTLQDGTALRAGTLDNDGTVQATGAVTVAGDVLNAGAMTLNGTQAFSGAFANSGVLNTTGALSFGGLFTNGGVLDAAGSLAFNGGLANTSAINAVNNDPTDRVTVGGAGLSGGGELRFDVNLSTEVGAADRVTMTDGAFITGNVDLRFNILGSGAQQPTDVVLIDVAAGDPGNFTVSADEIVDPSGILTYSVIRNAAGDVVIEDALNPGIAGLAGNIVLTQSLIGSVVNRPSSPFVTSLAYDDPNPCGSGMWARAIGGGARSEGEVAEDGLDDGAFNGQISAYFAGVQMGADFACFNGAYNGWDLALGAIGGVNVGQTSQPVFAIDLEAESNLSALQTSTTSVDFTQFYSGVYATGVNGPWALDLQYRFERTGFSATNEGEGSLPGLGLDNTEFDSFATTLSGAASYLYSVPDSDMSLVPTAGFALTQVSTDPIDFASRGTIQIDDFDSRIGFVGGTMAISSFGEDGVSAFQEFVSATAYRDFADGPRSTFSPVDGSGDRRVQTENLGSYGEISLGWNYVRILQENEFGAVKQLSANARADVRFSRRLSSWGIAAQARYQF